MQYRFVAILALLATAACSAPAELAPAPAPADLAAVDDLGAWQTHPTEAYRGKRDPISFVDLQTGWYGTGAGDLFRTADGGASWEKVAAKPGTFVRALAFLDRQTGYIGNIGPGYYPGVTDPVPLYRTDDGGATWQAVDTGGATIPGVCAIDVVPAAAGEAAIIHAAGRVGGPTGILRSIDGGKTWSVIDMAGRIAMITDVAFRDARTGFVFGATDVATAKANGLVLMTRDGGATWSEVYRSARTGEIIWKAHFPTRTTGYGAVQSYDQANSEQRVIKTTDGGATWRELTVVADSGAREFGIGFIDADTGFIGTAKGGFATEDGGQSWRAVPIAPAANNFQPVVTPAGARIFAIGTQVQSLAYTLR
ncbi:WD40/YVTN/BNR-like repeat-containing protein [Tsuneonella sp. HG222]